ncbi:4-hydroxybenzoate octaprenyltransferase [Granulosicoccus antarcticus]|uniref:4-hydroxybenzoate octaprenyltransferase n=1 Tax=Granulosicoccus antarcticus TaxID=437505 RepID=UPI001F009EC8|nr:4-hydroxybenzoate octaprenyltransferase [Granulosicoccus antarcticus]
MNITEVGQKLPHFVALTRLNRPIGIYLLMWPMLWALWFAAKGVPRLDVLFIFIVGTVLTRSAGCAINDYADRDIDGHVARTHQRPLATGALTAKEALLATGVLLLTAFILVLFTNALTIKLSLIAAALAIAYPFAKRHTHWPQVVLGAAFGFAIPMAYAAQTNQVPPQAWWLFISAVLWAVAYDTLYAMADREDDLKIGVKSTAILFGRFDLIIVVALQLIVLCILALIGLQAGRGMFYFIALALSCGFIVYQQSLVRERDPARCVQAFLNNNWLGMTVFIGLALDYALHP